MRQADVRNVRPLILLRQYEQEECGTDGYPFAWHKPTTYEEEGRTTQDPAIKDLIRAQAGNRCIRCGHPYPPGVVKTHPKGEWTPCDDQCAHGGPVRVWAGEDEDGNVNWEVVPDLDSRAWMGDRGRETFKMQAHWRVLTVHHANGVKSDCRPFNLLALCQKCHLSVQARVNLPQTYPYEHSEWFKPYAAAYYALVYEDRTISIEEARADMKRLLAHECVA